ncbi:MAG: hypothetical protein ACXV5Q_05930 [Frankiaceae bacterium]
MTASRRVAMGGAAMSADFAAGVSAELEETVRELDEDYRHLWPAYRKRKGGLADCWPEYPGFMRVARLYKARRDELELGEFGHEAQMELERFVEDVVAQHAIAVQKQCRHDHREVEEQTWVASPPRLPGDRSRLDRPAADVPVSATRRPVGPEGVVRVVGRANPRGLLSNGGHEGVGR